MKSPERPAVELSSLLLSVIAMFINDVDIKMMIPFPNNQPPGDPPRRLQATDGYNFIKQLRRIPDDTGHNPSPTA